VRASRYFLELEDRRRKDIEDWEKTQIGNLGVVLIDRLLVSCAIVQQRVGDRIGYATMVDAVDQGKMIVPHRTFFLRLTDDSEEYKRRKQQRIPFENSDIVYDPTGYEAFFRYWNENHVDLHPMYFDSARWIKSCLLYCLKRLIWVFAAMS